jgi:hypothetical protein
MLSMQGRKGGGVYRYKHLRHVIVIVIAIGKNYYVVSAVIPSRPCESECQCRRKLQVVVMAHESDPTLINFSAVSHSNWCTEFCTEVALAQYNKDIYSTIFHCLFEQSGDVSTALLIKLNYHKGCTDKPIGSGVYVIMRYESHIIQTERPEDTVQFRNRDGTGKNPKKKTRIKLSDLTPNDAGLLDSEDFVFDSTHK